MPQLLGFAALAFAQLFDYTSFLLMINRHGLSAEANPIVVLLHQEAGLPGLTLAKLGTVAFAALLTMLIAPRRRKLAMGLLIFGVGAGLLGGFSNIATL